jgi:hypothetical protein
MTTAIAKTNGKPKTKKTPSVDGKTYIPPTRSDRHGDGAYFDWNLRIGDEAAGRDVRIEVFVMSSDEFEKWKAHGIVYDKATYIADDTVVLARIDADCRARARDRRSSPRHPEVVKTLRNDLLAWLENRISISDISMLVTADNCGMFRFRTRVGDAPMQIELAIGD